MSVLTIEQRFSGPPGCANGGYFAGRFAGHSPDLLSVRLLRPIPLEQPLTVRTATDGILELEHQGAILARGRPVVFRLEVPPAPDYVQALEASRRFVGLKRHPFPSCFVCGTERARGDGLRIFAGAVSGRELVAGTWVPDASLSAGDGKVRPEFMSAALDCPGYAAARDDGAPLLLGEYTAHVARCVHIDEPCVVIGWRLAAAGRRFEVGTALFDEDGELCARARAVWIEPRR